MALPNDPVEGCCCCSTAGLLSFGDAMLEAHNSGKEINHELSETFNLQILFICHDDELPTLFTMFNTCLGGGENTPFPPSSHGP